jgi:hypothetical protein
MIQEMGDGGVLAKLPAEIFNNGTQNFTIQALWDVPPAYRHESYANTGSVSATWLYAIGKDA